MRRGSSSPPGQIQDGRWNVVSDYVGFSGLKSVQKDGKLVVESEFFKDR